MIHNDDFIVYQQGFEEAYTVITGIIIHEQMQKSVAFYYIIH